MLIKTVTVLHHDPLLDPDVPIFTPESREGDPGRAHSLLLDPAVWVELGRPETITVTIEPGDHLNV